MCYLRGHAPRLTLRRETLRAFSWIAVAVSRSHEESATSPSSLLEKRGLAGISAELGSSGMQTWATWLSSFSALEVHELRLDPCHDRLIQWRGSVLDHQFAVTQDLAALNGQHFVTELLSTPTDRTLT